MFITDSTKDVTKGLSSFMQLYIYIEIKNKKIYS